ncbi:DUF3667 domain-containing protein [Dokdonella sp.]|uniref:DUF3667 domain-containing protein n=1 Tax=Dokdonella sp. TaxID=2291710 RepID=UPI001B0AB1DD|nr:DUF3667 domain-containing protein [Dokdonella sp.]MBO9663989.1 DUF3667 domain-containing protein [Dokdonella sp.]
MDPGETCANCGAVLGGEYCHACGQKRFVASDRRFGHLLRQFLASATDLDGRIWRTLRALLLRPGLLSREYMEGRRAGWISPVSLFLAVSVVYFLAPLHGGDFALQFMQQVSGRVRALAASPDERLSAEQLAGTGQAHTRFTERWVDARVRARDAAARQASNGAAGYGYRDYRNAYDAKADEVSKALVILHVPLAALVLAVLFARQRRYFAEHFVVALHYFAFALASLLIVIQMRALLRFSLPAAWLPPEATYDWTMRVLLPVYAVLALRRSYAVGWGAAIAAAAAMLAVIVAANLYVYRAVQFAVTFALT